MSDPILELLAAPPSPEMSVDETAVYAGGRRRVRRRALRRTGFGVGAAAAAAAVAFAVVGPNLGTDALPAGPPSTTTSARGVSASLFDGAWSVEVRPDAPADQPNVVFYKGAGASRQQLAGSSADPTVVSMGTGSGAEGVMLGTAPADAARFMTLTKAGTTGGVQEDTQLLPGTDYQAVALKFDVPADTEKYVGTIWMSDKGDGVVRNAMGTILPSMKLAGRDTFWVDREAGQLGVFTVDGASAKPIGTGLTTTMGYGQKAEGGLWSWRSVTLLPQGAHSIDFTWSGDETHSQAFVEELPSGEVVAFADGSAVGGTGPIVTTVTWTDQAGTRHTDPAN